MPNIFGLFVIVRRSLWYCGTFANSHLTSEPPYTVLSHVVYTASDAPVWAKIQPFWLKLKSKETEIMRVSTICELGTIAQRSLTLEPW